MSFWQLPADPRLAGLTDAFSCSMPDGEPSGTAIRLIPDGRCELVFALDPATGRCRGEVFGIRSRSALIVAAATENIALRLHPLATASLLGVAAAELRDASVSIEELWGASGRELEDALSASPTLEERRARIADALHERREAARARERCASGPARVRAALRHIHVARGQLALGALARELAISPRQLEREFGAHVGLTPKRYARIVRLHAALRALADERRKVDAAAAAGLYDQAHLSREARALGGGTLTELARSPHVATTVAITSFR